MFLSSKNTKIFALIVLLTIIKCPKSYSMQYLATAYCQYEFNENNQIINKKNVLQIWQINEKKKLILIKSKNHNNYVLSLCFHPKDLNILVSSHSKGKILIWDIQKIETQEPIKIQIDPDRGGVLKVLFHPQNPNIIVACVNNNIKVIEKINNTWGDTIKSIDAQNHNDNDTKIVSLAFSEDGKHLASGANNGEIKIWNATNWNMVKMLQGDQLLIDSSINDLQFSSHDQNVLMSGSDSSQVRIFKTENGTWSDSQKIKELIERINSGTEDRGENSYNHNPCVEAIAWHPKNPNICLSTHRITMMIWNKKNDESWKNGTISSMIPNPYGRYGYTRNMQNKNYKGIVFNDNGQYFFAINAKWIEIWHSPDNSWKWPKLKDTIELPAPPSCMVISQALEPKNITLFKKKIIQNTKYTDMLITCE